MATQSKIALIAGYGPGISSALAKRLGAEGYKLALLARTKSRLDEAAAGLSQSGITAKGYPTDLSDAAAVKATVAAVQQDMGPISVLHWNAYASGGGADLLSVPPEEFVDGFRVSVTGLVAAVQAAHSSLKSTQGTVLVTGGGLALEQDASAQMAVDYRAASLAVAKAAQRKLVHVMHKALADDGIYVADVTVCGMVSGTSYDPEGKSGLTPEAIAEEFWSLLHKRDPSVWFVIKA